jgi:hypothetical protein
MLCKKVHLSLVSTKFHVVQKSRLVHLSGQLGKEKKTMGKKEKKIKSSAMIPKSSTFSNASNPKENFIPIQPHKMCEILGLGLGFPALLGTKHHLSKISCNFYVSRTNQLV